VSWLTWRQFRTQAVVAGAALAVLAACLVVLEFQLRHAYAVDTAAATRASAAPRRSPSSSPGTRLPCTCWTPC
jgi:hypothetical protein